MIRRLVLLFVAGLAAPALADSCLDGAWSVVTEQNQKVVRQCQDDGVSGYQYSAVPLTQLAIAFVRANRTDPKVLAGIEAIQPGATADTFIQALRTMGGTVNLSPEPGGDEALQGFLNRFNEWSGVTAAPATPMSIDPPPQVVSGMSGEAIDALSVSNAQNLSKIAAGCAAGKGFETDIKMIEIAFSDGPQPTVPLKLEKIAGQDTYNLYFVDPKGIQQRVLFKTNEGWFYRDKEGKDWLVTIAEVPFKNYTQVRAFNSGTGISDTCYMADELKFADHAAQVGQGVIEATATATQ